MSKRSFENAQHPLQNGSVAEPLDVPRASVDEWLVCFVRGTGKWFSAQLAAQGEDSDNLRFSTVHELCLIYDVKQRKVTFIETDCDKIRRAMSGNVNPQGRPDKGLLLSGFGVASHLRGSEACFWSMHSACDAFERATGQPGFCDGGAHLIMKPPVGKLSPHVDTFSVAKLLNETRRIGCAEEWVQLHGVQTLAHLAGAGPSEKGGHTTTLSNLTVPNFHLMLTMVIYEHPMVPGKIDVETAGGPIFVRFNCSVWLKELNRLLECVVNSKADAWLDALPEFEKVALQRCTPGVIASVPICTQKEGPYLAVWLKGWPHWVTKGDRLRFTINLHLSPVKTEEGQANLRRCYQRVLALQEGRGDEVREDRQPFEQGRVHQHPENEVDNYPFFKDCYPPAGDIRAFLETI
jgi:hypothetical protein